jgi:hypothetical protein
MTCLNMPKINYSFHHDRSNLTSHNNKYFKSEKNKKRELDQVYTFIIVE